MKKFFALIVFVIMGTASMSAQDLGDLFLAEADQELIGVDCYCYAPGDCTLIEKYRTYSFTTSWTAGTLITTLEPTERWVITKTSSCR